MQNMPSAKVINREPPKIFKNTSDKWKGLKEKLAASPFNPLYKSNKASKVMAKLQAEQEQSLQNYNGYCVELVNLQWKP